MQYNKTHAVTVSLTAIAIAARFISYAGTHASASAGGTADSCGVSETGGEVGDAVSAITSYSAPVQSSAAISAGAWVKPAADGSGRAVTGSVTDHCGRALTAATGADELIEVEVLPHVHA